MIRLLVLVLLLVFGCDAASPLSGVEAPPHGSAAYKTAQTPIPVVLLAGQSNASGPRATPEPEPVDAHVLHTAVYLNPAWRPLTPPIRGRISVDFPYLRLLAAETASDVAGIKHTLPGSTMSCHWRVDGPNPALCPSGGRMLYAENLALVASRLDSLRARGFTPYLETILFWQGESDTSTPARAAAYGEELAVLLDQWRLDLGALFNQDLSTLNIVVFVIPHHGTQNRAAVPVVQEAQRQVCAGDSRVFCIETEHYDKVPGEPWHVDVDGVMDAGTTAFNALRQWGVK